MRRSNLNWNQGVARNLRSGTAAIALAAVTWCLGCNQTPASGTLDDMTIEVEARLSNTDAVKLDIVWVIDNSSSMCQEQNSLVQNVAQFIETFSAFRVDLRLAVVNTDVLTESASGAFQNKLFTKSYPPNCFQGEVFPCLKDAECVDEFGDGWVCEPPVNGQASYLQNSNCSVNSQCRYKCGDDAECQDTFSIDDIKCVKPGGDVAQSRCQSPPAIAGCPAELPLWVSTEDDNIDLFRCLALVGAEQATNPQFEQGINAAMWALSKTPLDGAPDRTQQAKEFLRDDAYQLIIFISDEDDCSLAIKNGKLADLPAEQRNKCICVKDETQGGPLLSVSSAAAVLRSINANPNRVLVAAIVGDVVVGEQGGLQCLNCPDDGNAAACVTERREDFKASKCAPGPVALNSYVCQSSGGKADYGSRYLELVGQFGQNGASANICNAEGFGPALEDIGDAILNRIVRYCLPRAVRPGTTVRVTLRDEETGATTTLTEGVEFEIVNAVDCPEDGPQKAVAFKSRLKPGQEIVLTYEASIFGN